MGWWKRKILPQPAVTLTQDPAVHSTEQLVAECLKLARQADSGTLSLKTEDGFVISTINKDVEDALIYGMYLYANYTGIANGGPTLH